MRCDGGEHVAAAAELGRDDDLPLPLGLADEQAGAGDVDVDEVHRSVFHASIPPTICRRCVRVVDPVHLRPDAEQAGAAAAVHVDHDVGLGDQEARDEVGELLVERPVGRAGERAVEVRAATATAACTRARPRARRTG